LTAKISAKQELSERIVRVYDDLSPKKRRVANFILRDYKTLFLMTAKELATACEVSEPTVMRFAIDLGFSGYVEFEKFIKGLLRSELTAVERLNKTNQRISDASTLESYSNNALTNIDNMLKSVTPLEQKRLAKAIFEAKSVTVAGFRASQTLAHYFGYALKKIRDDVSITTAFSAELTDAISLREEGHLLFAIAFPRYPRKMVELVGFAKKMGSTVVALSDSHSSPIVTSSDQYAVVDMVGVSFIDPFEHIIAFLASLAHEIAFIDRECTAKRLKLLEEGALNSQDYFTEGEEEIVSDGNYTSFANLSEFKVS
jgi:DNA-binding MurR/RpiR family transcriptional regulator